MTREEVSVGRIISRGFGVIANNPVTILGIALLLGGIPTVVFSYYQQTLITGATDTEQAIGVLVVSLGGALVSMFCQAIVQGSLVRATIAYANGEKSSFGESIGAGLARALPLIGLSIIVALGVGFGFLLLIVPGVMLYVIWSVATPALVAERIGVFDALGRSRDLTRGARWQVFGVMAILLVATWMFAGAYAAAMLGTTGFDNDGMNGLADDGPSFVWILVEGLYATATITVWSTVTAALYLELRNWKEGPADKALEDIFA